MPTLLLIARRSSHHIVARYHVQFGPPPIDLIDTRSYADLYMMLTPPIPPGAAFHDTAYSLTQSSDAALDDLVVTAQERPSSLTLVNVHQFYGAAAWVAPDAAALALREPHLVVVNISMWLEGTGYDPDNIFHRNQNIKPIANNQ